MTANNRIQVTDHEHGLVLREYSDNCSLPCDICDLPVKSGPAYHCPDCWQFFLAHKFCVGPPTEIQHSSHSQHRLVLSKFSLTPGLECSGCSSKLDDGGDCYQCDACKVALHVGCATLPPPDDGHDDKETIHHFAHEHPLTSFHVNIPNQIQCKACQKPVYGVAYGCRGCIFVLHESCAVLPPEIKQHPFHPQHPLTLRTDLDKNITCEFCRDEGFQFLYRCDECDYKLDVGCAITISHPPQGDQEDEEHCWKELNHFLHPHPLASVRATMDLTVMCQLCEEYISAGDLYCCPGCLFVIHSSCAEITREFVHPLHPDHVLLYINDHGEERLPYCLLCGINNGITDCIIPRFHCTEEHCSFVIDMKCAAKSNMALKSGAGLPNKHFQGHLTKLSCDYFRNCEVCGKMGGLCYCCEEGRSNSIHNLPSKINHPFHPEHPILVSMYPSNMHPITCSACHEQAEDHTYYCAQCYFKMDARCALKRPSLKHQRHEHSLTYFEKTGRGQFLCNLCSSDCSIDLYRCIPCNYNLHYDCAYLPASVKHELHIHEMFLRDRVVDDFYDEQYCDLCETVRHPEHGVYYCNQCRCAAHIDCVIPKQNSEAGSKLLAEDFEKMLAEMDQQIESAEEEAAQAIETFERKMANLEGLKKQRQEIDSSENSICTNLSNTKT